MNSCVLFSSNSQQILIVRGDLPTGAIPLASVNGGLDWLPERMPQRDPPDCGFRHTNGRRGMHRVPERLPGARRPAPYGDQSTSRRNLRAPSAPQRSTACCARPQTGSSSTRRPACSIRPRACSGAPTPLTWWIGHLPGLVLVGADWTWAVDRAGVCCGVGSPAGHRPNQGVAGR